MHRRSFMIVVCLTVSSALAAEEPAGGAGPGPVESVARPPQNGPGTTYQISAGATHQSSTDVEHHPGAPDQDFSMTRYGLNAGVSYPVNNKTTFIDHNLTYEYDDYDFDGPASFVRDSTQTAVLLSEDPWDDSHLLSYSLNLAHRLNDDWSIIGGPSIGLAGESGADWSDAITYGLSLGVRHRISEDLAVGIGVIYVGGLEQTQFLPLVLLDWQISDKVHLQNARPQPGLRGTAGAELAWEIAPRWTVAGGFAFDRRRFRLDDDDFPADGIAQNSSFPVYVRAGYELSDHWRFGAIAGVLLGGELRLENEDGHQIGETDYDEAPFVGVSAGYTF